ncbi:hypothetical protein N7517_003150 [Penicillium concentricum]|uniref:Uncharacterized protein n=1 Tax=Penicillium concentricum TaxID=293559 RepID=A0A9W9VL72_9EURO|nr:uncharacterized protein N7517_003150 [Penicillium concentricum]KAJ5385239.1 hypothetical protein N7517_003150 [Penicillium concentricum]
MQSRQSPPTYEESTQNAMEIYTKLVEHTKTPEDLLEPLLSDKLTIDEKQKLIEEAPDVVFLGGGNNTTRTPSLETRLENAKCDELAQIVAYRDHLLNAPDRGWCNELIKLDITLRVIVQRRIWLKQKFKALQIQTYQKRSIDNSDRCRLKDEENKTKSPNSIY